LSSLAIGAGVGALVALLLSQGARAVSQRIDEKTGDTILGVTQPDGTVTNVQLKNNAVISPQFDFVRIETNKTVFNDDNNPNYFLKNTSSVIKRIFALSIIPDPVFQSDGLIKITLNGVTFFPITESNAGVFQNTTAINVPIPDTYGLKILPKDELRVFIRSPSGSVVNCTIAVFIGELP